MHTIRVYKVTTGKNAGKYHCCCSVCGLETDHAKADRATARDWVFRRECKPWIKQENVLTEYKE